jgi:hypothetical protein
VFRGRGSSNSFMSHRGRGFSEGPRGRGFAGGPRGRGFSDGPRGRGFSGDQRGRGFSSRPHDQGFGGRGDGPDRGRVGFDKGQGRDCFPNIFDYHILNPMSLIEFGGLKTFRQRIKERSEFGSPHLYGCNMWNYL